VRSHLRDSPTFLLSQGLKTSSSQKVKDRMKDQRLRGSDLYVARLCWRETEDHPSFECNKVQTDVLKGLEIDLPSDGDCQPVQTLTGSLHDELRFCKPKGSQSNAERSRFVLKKPTATLSRPCYRCISYMYSAGIKRVFWTNTRGKWEGAKVQELVDASEGSSSSAGNGSGGGSDRNSLFVTKHEVLMLRKTTGQ